GNVALLKSVKGIGLKTAERIVVDLKGKVLKGGQVEGLTGDFHGTTNNHEAIAALVALGFPKNNTEKAVDAVFKQNPQQSVEELIRNALQRL
ncbi:MAG: Holliday junction branch migration protein RuvA, partial [Bacteroidales bacterium]